MILIAAIAVGCIAAFVVLKYVSGVEDRANGDAERVSVLVVRADIPQGVPGEQAVQEGWIVEDEIAREFLPATRITDFDQITGKVALNTLAANQVLVEGMFVDPTTNSIGFGQRLEENHVAYTISVDSTSGVAGLLVPGDLVDIFHTGLIGVPEGTSGDSGSATAAASADTFGQDARLLYHQVRILAIGTQTAPQPGEEQAAAEGEDAAAAPEVSGLLTLDLPVEAAQLLASLDSSGLRLALTGPDYQAQAIPRIDPGEVEEFPGETDARNRFGTLTPYGPDGPQ
jgi:Flp pilus assembly protein CpaB